MKKPCSGKERGCAEEGERIVPIPPGRDEQVDKHQCEHDDRAQGGDRKRYPQGNIQDSLHAFTPTKVIRLPDRA